MAHDPNVERPGLTRMSIIKIIYVNREGSRRGARVVQWLARPRSTERREQDFRRNSVCTCSAGTVCWVTPSAGTREFKLCSPGDSAGDLGSSPSSGNFCLFGIFTAPGLVMLDHFSALKMYH